MYHIKQITTKIFQENIYFIINKENNQTLIIDPGEIAFEELLKFFKNESLTPVGILNTHAHPDHISSVFLLQTHYDIPFFIHDMEEIYLKDIIQLGHVLGFDNFKMPEKITYIKEGMFEYKSFKLQIIHTPGHTKGGICIKFDNSLISGDTLFENSVGRVDLPGGSMIEMKTSIEILKKLDKKLVVYPGHGPVTTIQHEIENNPYF